MNSTFFPSLRKTTITCVAAAALFASSAIGHAMDKWVIKDSANTVDMTVSKLTAAVEKAGAKVFAVVDHAKGAKSINAELAPTTLVIFGNPKLGTPILQANQRAGIDLPVHVLVWAEDGKTKIGYISAIELQARHGISGADEALKKISGAVGKLTDAASK